MCRIGDSYEMDWEGYYNIIMAARVISPFPHAPKSILTSPHFLICITRWSSRNILGVITSKLSKTSGFVRFALGDKLYASVIKPKTHSQKSSGQAPDGGEACGTHVGTAPAVQPVSSLFEVYFFIDENGQQIPYSSLFNSSARTGTSKPHLHSQLPSRRASSLAAVTDQIKGVSQAPDKNVECHSITVIGTGSSMPCQHPNSCTYKRALLEVTVTHMNESHLLNAFRVQRLKEYVQERPETVRPIDRTSDGKNWSSNH
jgi:hypothetical protein